MEEDGVTEIHKIKFCKMPPHICSDVLMEALESLRSALDQTGYATAVLSGKINPKKTHFPFGEDETGLKDVIQRNCKNLPKEVITLFESFKPYRAGNPFLWSLNKLRNANHSVLTPVGYFMGPATYTNINIQNNGSIFVPRWDSDKNEIVTARVGPGGSVSYDAQFSYSVAINAPDVIESMPASVALTAMANEVDNILKATKDECRRIGLLN